MTWISIITYMLLMMSYFFGFSAKTWFFFWFSMELNSLMFISILRNNSVIQMMFKYFMIQVLSSILFFCLIMMTPLLVDKNTFSFFIFLIAAMKLGLWPFFFWLPYITRFLNWTSWFLINSFQKIIPMYMLSFFPKYLYISCSMTLLFSVLLLKQELNFKKMMFYSSMVYLSWMLSILNSSNSWLMFLMFYSLILFFFLFFFNKNIIISMNSILLVKTNSYLALSMILYLTVLLGFPPFLGFQLKMLILMEVKSLLMMMVLLLSTFCMLAMYLNVFLVFFIKKMNKLNNFKEFNFMFFMTVLLYMLIM